MSIENYHAHVYFSGDEESRRARALLDAAAETFGGQISIGRFHEQPIGPHPRGSCQITVQVGDFESVVTWLSMHREGITVFCHLNTGKHLADHTEHVIWLGESERLNTDIFRQRA